MDAKEKVFRKVKQLDGRADRSTYDEAWALAFDWERFQDWISSETDQDLIRAAYAIAGRMFIPEIEREGERGVRHRNRPTGTIRKTRDFRRRCSFVACVLDTERLVPWLTGKYLKADWATVQRRWLERHPQPYVGIDTAKRNFRKWFDECLPVIDRFIEQQGPIELLALKSRFCRNMAETAEELDLTKPEDRAYYECVRPCLELYTREADRLEKLLDARKAAQKQPQAAQ